MGEENPIYNNFISLFNSESDSEEFSEKGEEDPILYERFISHFHSDSEEETDEDKPIYERFISHFHSDSESSYETDSSDEISSEPEDEVLAFDDNEAEEQVLPIIAPRAMIYNASVDSNFSEDTINLLNFNRGFAPAISFGFEEDGDDCLSPYPLVMA